MRLSTDEGRDEERAFRTIAAAAGAGISVFDTAHAYGRGPDELGHNERLLARALRRSGADGTARVVTKGGMGRAGGAWIPDGRAKAILADCEASLAALEGMAIDLYLIHAPDHRTPWSTSVRALARLLDEGLVRHVGVANVNRGQVDEANGIVPLTAVQVAVGPFDDRALRGGVVERCAELGIAVMAHTPLGGPRRAGRLGRDRALTEIAARRGATAAEVTLAWLMEMAPGLIPIPGARRPETARSAAHAANLVLDPEDGVALARAFHGVHRVRPARPRVVVDGADVVLVMGIPGAGKSVLAADYVDRGYVRLNRDERGGSLRETAEALDAELSSGGRRIVLDNTYLTRASRSHAIEAAERHGAATRCVWLDTPLAQAQVNLVERLLERFDALPGPEELRGLARGEPRLLMPTSQMRALRELEPPSADEGLAAVERVPFVRRASPERLNAGVLVGAGAVGLPGWQRAVAEANPDAPHLVFDWRPGGDMDLLAAEMEGLSAEVSGPVEGAVCPHPAGPPRCWCRPPLPGLPLAFARTRGVDLSRSIFLGAGPAHRTLAATFGARYVEV